MAVDFKSLGRNEQGALIAGVVTTVLSFFPYYLKWGPFHTDAWTSYATFGVLLVIVATAVIALKALQLAELPSDVPWSLIAMAAAGLGTFLLFLRAITISPGGPGWSGVLMWIGGLALTFFAIAIFRASGESVPGREAPPAPPAA